jgi:hypothetical protein
MQNTCYTYPMQNTLNNMDVLKHIENLAENTNALMEKRSKSILRRYPITFTLLVLIGAIALSEGLKGLFGYIGISDNPLILLVIGLIILTVTGTLFKKLNK